MTQGAPHRGPRRLPPKPPQGWSDPTCGWITALFWRADCFDRALAARATELRDVEIRSTISTRPRAVLKVDPSGEYFYMMSLHFLGYDRRMHDAGRCDYMPVNLGEIDDYYARNWTPLTLSSSRPARLIPMAISTSVPPHFGIGRLSSGPGMLCRNLRDAARAAD